MLAALCSLNLLDRNYYDDLVIRLSWGFAGMGIVLQIAAIGLTIWVRRSGKSFIDNAGNAYHKAARYLEQLGFDEFKRHSSDFIWQGTTGLISWIVITFFLAKWSIPYMIATVAISMLLISIPTWLKQYID